MRDRGETGFDDLEVRGLTDTMILPAQGQGEARALRDPGQRLRLAVLEDAIRYVRGYARSVDRRERALYEDAVDWFASPDRTEPFAFENVCGALGLDADGLRQRVGRWRQVHEVSITPHPVAPGGRGAGSAAGRSGRHLRAA